MKYIKQFFSWLSILLLGEPLRFESNHQPIYENRKERRKRRYEALHPWTAFWKGIPWYKNKEYYNTACSVYADAIKQEVFGYTKN